MSFKSSTSSNDSHLSSSVNSSLPLTLFCFDFNPGRSVFTIYTVTILLLVLPLCILVLYHGQRWWKQSKAATTRHADSFTYHLVVIELMSVFGTCLYCSSIYLNPFPLSNVWSTLFSFNWVGESLFHILTCLELYFAAVHPIAYLRLRKQRWVIVRHIVTGCVWLSCVIGTVLSMSGNSYLIGESWFLIFCLFIICFCSLSVLWVLIRPGPGSQVRDRARVDQSKLRAFCTILVILGVLLLRVIWLLVWTVLGVVREVDDCMELMCEIWINLPGTLLLPLLFLKKNGMLACWKNNKWE